MRIIFISILLSATIVSCENKYKKAADEIAAAAPKNGNMNAGKKKYSLYIPGGWTTEYQTVYGVDYYYIMAPKTRDNPNTSINVSSEFMQHLSLQDYLKGTIASVKKTIPSAVILNEGEIRANGLQGVWYSYNMEPQGLQVSLVCYIFQKDGVAYLITAGTQTKDAVKYRTLFNKVAQSFRFSQ